MNWRAVLGYEGLYEVSGGGEVRRVARGKKFTAERVQEAKRMLAAKAKLREVAAFMGASIPTVMRIKHGAAWTGDETQRPCKVGWLKHYRVIRLCKNGKYRCHSIHRLMWEAFNGPIPGRLEINHKNLDRADNRLENLELVTHQQNVQHAFDIYRQDSSSRQPAGRAGSYRGRYFKQT